MKISSETLQLLKNFASINMNILFRPGDVISTISSSNSIFAKATIKETIPNELAIYDLSSLLAMMTIIDNQDIIFNPKSVSIVSPAGKFEYFYSNPDTVVAAPTGTIEHVDVHKFTLTAEEVQMVMKAASITGAPSISITCREQAVVLSVGDRKNLTASNFKKDLGTSFNAFDVHIAVENLKIIPDAYEISVAKTANGKAKFLHFNHLSRSLQYWIACEPDSIV
jgi:hypothetical protein